MRNLITKYRLLLNKLEKITTSHNIYIYIFIVAEKFNRSRNQWLHNITSKHFFIWSLQWPQKQIGEIRMDIQT